MRSMVMGPGACSDIRVSRVTCTLGRLGSEEKLEVCWMHPPTPTPPRSHPWPEHTHGRQQGTQKHPLVLGQALIVGVQLLDL